MAVQKWTRPDQQGIKTGLSEAIESCFDFVRLLLACRIGVATPSARAAASTSARKRAEGPKSALMRTAMVFDPGIRSRKSSSRFAANSPEKIAAPVAFPPGRLRLATKPSRTGSPPLLKMIGIVLVALEPQ